MVAPSDSEAPSLDPAVLYERIAAGEAVSVLDVRGRADHEAWPLTGAGVRTVVTPYARFVAAEVNGTVSDLVPDLPEPVVVVCGRGETSAHVAALLRAEGVEAVNLAGGMRGWARLYLAREVADPGVDATVLQYQRPASGCLAYLVVSGDEAAVVDPLRAFADRYVADAEERGAVLRYAVDTHVHADHVSGVRDVASASGATVALPDGARDRGLDRSTFDGDVRFVGDGDDLRVGAATLRAVHAPGHTSEMTAYRLGDLLFGGDTLFVESVARPDLEVGADGAAAMARRLHATLADRILTLPPETRVAPGHFSDAADPAPDGTYTATLADLRERLPLLGLSVESFAARAVAEMPDRPANYERIIEVNLGRAAADDDEAFELELGPNNCAVAA